MTHSTVIQQHLNSNHNRWCHQRKGDTVVCRFTGDFIKRVDSRGQKQEAA